MSAPRPALPRPVRLMGLTGLLVAWLGGVPPARAADDDSALRAQLEQRLRLSAALLADGSSTQRIVASALPRALALLDEGKVHHAMAQDLLARGDLAGARREVDEALRHLSQARRLVPDLPSRQQAARARYEQMLGSLERLLQAWRSRLGSSGAGEGPSDHDLTAAVGLLGSARALGAEQRYDEALRTLASAEGHVLAGMNRLLQSRTLDYTARAETPAEEYQLELQRLGSLAELVPLAVNDLKPKAEAMALIERYTEASSTLRHQAQQRFAAGDAPQALAHLRNALLFVQRALTTAGLVVPQSAGGTP